MNYFIPKTSLLHHQEMGSIPYNHTIPPSKRIGEHISQGMILKTGKACQCKKALIE
jgi:hypothetical protein